MNLFSGAITVHYANKSRFKGIFGFNEMVIGDYLEVEECWKYDCFMGEISWKQAIDDANKTAIYVAVCRYSIILPTSEKTSRQWPV